VYIGVCAILRKSSGGNNIKRDPEKWGVRTTLSLLRIWPNVVNTVMDFLVPEKQKAMHHEVDW
jgi:hypothetical protein